MCFDSVKKVLEDRIVLKLFRGCTNGKAAYCYVKTMSGSVVLAMSSVTGYRAHRRPTESVGSPCVTVCGMMDEEGVSAVHVRRCKAKPWPASLYRAYILCSKILAAHIDVGNCRADPLTRCFQMPPQV